LKKSRADQIPLCRTVEQMPPSGIRKFFQLTSSMPDVISLSIGEPDFVTPWHIRETAIYALENGYTMYTANAGLIELRYEVSRYLAREYKLKYSPEEEVLITTGTSEALDLALRAILNPGDEVIIPDPYYVAYPALITMAGGQAVKVATFEKNGFNLRAKDMRKAITSSTRAILIGNPANPTGAIFLRQELLEIADFAREHNLLVIADEIYSSLVYENKHVCFPTLKEMQERTILINGLSKSHAMTGWRVGYAAAPQEIIALMTKIHQYTMLCAPIMAQMAAAEALKRGDADVKAMVSEYNQRRKFMLNGFKEMGLSCCEPRGAFYCFPSIKSSGLSSEEFSTRLLHEEKVAVVPGTAFGEGGEGYVRCCYATSLKDIREALKRIRRFLQSLP
jgi:aminotransferase